MVPRTVQKIVKASLQSEGVGAKVRRSIGTRDLRRINPFLMLDDFAVPPGAGFSDHPHRGFETITLMLDGQMQHEDFSGHAGVIDTGGIQAMTAGKGLMHAEIPVPRADGLPVTGLQLWIALPDDMRMCDPRYRNMDDGEIPHAHPSDNVDIKVIAGESHGVKSGGDIPVVYTPIYLFDVRITKDGKFSQPIPKGWNAFIYILTGSAKINNDTNVDQHHNIVFSQTGESIEIANEGETELRFLLGAGQPTKGEIVQYGPFIAGDMEGIQQAMIDYQSNSNGFERVKNWKSKIGATM